MVRFTEYSHRWILPMPVQFKPLYERYEIKPDGCWQWTGNKTTAHGYGVFLVNGRKFRAHRYFYEFFNSTRIPPDMVIDHLCQNPGCVNPQHMEVVTQGVNARRGTMKTECMRGHPYSGDNLYITPDGTKKCRACMKIWASRRNPRPRWMR